MEKEVKGRLNESKNFAGPQRKDLLPHSSEKSPRQAERSEIFLWSTETKGTWFPGKASRNSTLSILVLRAVYRYTCQ